MRSWAFPCTLWEGLCALIIGVYQCPAACIHIGSRIQHEGYLHLGSPELM